MAKIIAREVVANEAAPGGAVEAANPAAEELFWRETYLREPYYVKGRTFEYYAPGFRAGWEGRVLHNGRSFNDAEPSLEASYNLGRSELDPVWQEVSMAARAAWDRVDGRGKTKR